MPLVLTSNAIITCAHEGVVAVLPHQEKVSIGGGFVICEGDLEAAPIAGCTQVAPGTKPCTTVVEWLPVSFSEHVLVQGRPVHLQTSIGTTDGVPPATVLVVFAGQETVQG
jgi:hypothetical protein